MPSVAQLGYPFNLTCVVHLRKTNAVFVAIDWFRPEHSYDNLIQSHSHGLPGLSGLHESTMSLDTMSNNQTAFMIHWFAQTFVQLTNRPSLGIRVYKQLLADPLKSYKSEVVFESATVSSLDAGFYECRAYEPVNRGDVRILDRAIVYVSVHRPFPHKQRDTGDWPERVGRLLALHWKILSGDLDRRAHDQYTQNDVATKNKDGYLPLSSDFSSHLSGRLTATLQEGWQKNSKKNTNLCSKPQMMYTLLLLTVGNSYRILFIFYELHG
ncbi:hypothetical protein CSKR_105205 [Clonorchis sinensis]|uniref:Ig-like domain-containing protein n=1 Tax=Clonorchis sinensis TaxID=79923 RepID=A0A8T1MU24_CLOSI|nr:hypothetical protein CSKR_105205 [Clonorchis sinensis]